MQAFLRSFTVKLQGKLIPSTREPCEQKAKTYRNRNSVGDLISICQPQVASSLNSRFHRTIHPSIHPKSLQSCPTLQSYGLQLDRLLCPWDSPGKNTLVGCHALLHGIFPTQGCNPLSLMPPALAGGFFTTRATPEALIGQQIL